jgi:hypothetical protein
VVLGTAAIVGHARGPLVWPSRLAAAAAGLLLFLPAESIPGAKGFGVEVGDLVLPAGLLLNLLGVALGAAVLLLDRARAPAYPAA